jgi:hypothetical protein
MTSWPRPDFLAGPPRQPLLAWLFALGGAAALVLASYSAWSMHAAFERATPAGTNVSAARAVTGSRAADAMPSSEGDADSRRAALRLSAAISYPWGAALASLEASTPAGVQWLVLDLSIESGEIRLEGQAADASSALRVVDSFGARPGWRDIALVRLQRADAREGGATSSALRFAIEARLDPTSLAAAADPGGS